MNIFIFHVVQITINYVKFNRVDRLEARFQKVSVVEICYEALIIRNEKLL